jgi:uncharacterized small protein (TIGR04563 family)
MGDRRQQCLYIPDELLDALLKRADKSDRSVSYIVQQACTYWLSVGTPDIRPLGRQKATK